IVAIHVRDAFGPVLHTRAGASFCDGVGECAHVLQAASGAWSGARPRVGRLRIQRWSSGGSIIVAFPLFRAVKAPSRIASKIFVRLTPALAAASSGLKPSRGMARPVVLG